MKRDITGIASIPCEGYRGLRLPREVQLKRLWAVIREELTEKERSALTMYYLDGMTLEEIGRELGVHKATVCRNRKRAEKKLRRLLKY